MPDIFCCWIMLACRVAFSSAKLRRFSNCSSVGSGMDARANSLMGSEDCALASISACSDASPARKRVRMSQALERKSLAMLPGSHMMSLRAPWSMMTGCSDWPRPGNWKFVNHCRSSAFLSSSRLRQVLPARSLFWPQTAMMMSRIDMYVKPLMSV